MEHLLELEEAVTNGILRDCHVIFRPHPWRAPAENEPDFYDIKWKHVSMDPTMKDCYNGPNTQRKIHLSSIEDTHSILNAIDLLVSNMSTILLEGIIHSKPVICMISKKDEESNDFLNVTFNALYFQELFKKGGITRCNELEKIGDYCQEQLKKSQEPDFTHKANKIASYFVKFNEKTYSTRLKDFIDEIIIN
jgi:CDP-glycerol glycerophosphotransferase (TagB/SpsB family)